MIAVGGKGQPTLDGVRNFVMDLDEMTGVEISGYEMARKEETKISHVFIAKYINNTRDESETPFKTAFDKTADKLRHFHTHPQRRDGITYQERIKASRKDLNGKRVLIEKYPQMKFMILTKGEKPKYY